MVIAVTLLLLTVVVAWGGVKLRNWTYANSSDLRMRWDIDNAWNRGHAVVTEARRMAGLAPDPRPPRWFEGWRSSDPGAIDRTRKLTWPEWWQGHLATYDLVAERAGRSRDGSPRFVLDYSPFRLAIMSAWVKDRLDRDAETERFFDADVWPLMHLNTSLAVAGAGAMFLTVLMWRMRTDRPRDQPAGTWLPPQDRTWIAALVAALIFFLNPSSILNSHAFVQWDTWVLPFVLLAMGLAAIDKWGWAGLVLGISMGFKGQQLLVLPVFLLWPIFRWKWGSAARFAVGFVFAFLCIGLPWLIQTPTAWLWVGTVIALAACFAPYGYPRRVGLTWWLAAGITTALVIGPYLNEEHVAGIWAALLIVAAIIVLPWTLPRPCGGPIVGLVAIAAILAASSRFDGSWNWLVVSYIWPSYQYKAMYMGPVHNLPAILASYGWTIDSVLWQGRIGSHDLQLQLRTVLVAIYGVCCVACAAAAAMQHRRRDPALLIALATPWVLMFALLPQMHERYLTWAAAVCGVGVACSIGFGLLHWVLIGISSVMIVTQMLSYNRGAFPHEFSILGRLQPGLGWMLLLAAGVYLYGSFARTRRAAAAPASIRSERPV